MFKACNFTTEGFKRFVKDVIFIPRPGVFIEVGNFVANQFSASFGERCSDCLSQWEGSNLERIIREVRWETIRNRADVCALVSF